MVAMKTMVQVHEVSEQQFSNHRKKNPHSCDDLRLFYASPVLCDQSLIRCICKSIKELKQQLENKKEIRDSRELLREKNVTSQNAAYGKGL